MRASVHVKLPNASKSKDFEKWCDKLRVQVRRRMWRALLTNIRPAAFTASTLRPRAACTTSPTRHASTLFSPLNLSCVVARLTTTGAPGQVGGAAGADHDRRSQQAHRDRGRPRCRQARPVPLAHCGLAHAFMEGLYARRAFLLALSSDERAGPVWCVVAHMPSIDHGCLARAGADGAGWRIVG